MILIANYLSNHDDTWAVFDHCEETLTVLVHFNISLRREGIPFVSSPKHGHWHSKEQRGAAPSKALPRILRNGTHHLVVGREVDKMFSKSSHPLFLIIIRLVYVAKPRSFKHSKLFSFCIALICEWADIKADKWAETCVLSRISRACRGNRRCNNLHLPPMLMLIVPSLRAINIPNLLFFLTSADFFVKDSKL